MDSNDSEETAKSTRTSGGRRATTEEKSSSLLNRALSLNKFSTKKRKEEEKEKERENALKMFENLNQSLTHSTPLSSQRAFQQEGSPRLTRSTSTSMKRSTNDKPEKFESERLQFYVRGTSAIDLLSGYKKMRQEQLRHSRVLSREDTEENLRDIMNALNTSHPLLNQTIEYLSKERLLELLIDPEPTNPLSMTSSFLQLMYFR
jgi:hypothetical protein